MEKLSKEEVHLKYAKKAVENHTLIGEDKLAEFWQKKVNELTKLFCL